MSKREFFWANVVYSPEALRALGSATAWNVQIQPAGRGATAVRYLARYVQGGAPGPKRLLGYDAGGNVLLRWTSSGTGRTGVLRLHPHELIRRWLLLVLPDGFPRVRRYGFLAPAAIRSLLLVRLLLCDLGGPDTDLPVPGPFRCPGCGGELVFLAEIKPFRAPRAGSSRRADRPRCPAPPTPAR